MLYTKDNISRKIEIREIPTVLNYILLIHLSFTITIHAIKIIIIILHYRPCNIFEVFSMTHIISTLAIAEHFNGTAGKLF